MDHVCSLYPPLRIGGWVMNIIISRWPSLENNYLINNFKHKHDDVIVCTDSTLPVYDYVRAINKINAVMLL